MKQFTKKLIRQLASNVDWDVCLIGIRKGKINGKNR